MPYTNTQACVCPFFSPILGLCWHDSDIYVYVMYICIYTVFPCVYVVHVFFTHPRPESWAACITKHPTIVGVCLRWLGVIFTLWDWNDGCTSSMSVVHATMKPSHTYCPYPGKLPGNVQNMWTNKASAQGVEQKLPPDWDEIFSKSTGKTYYYNRLHLCVCCIFSICIYASNHVIKQRVGLSFTLP